MALCAGVAAVTLSVGAIGSVGAMSRRLVAIRVPLPVRPLATLLLMTSLITVASRPRPATATIAPPIVRLADESVTGEREEPPSPPAASEPGVSMEYIDRLVPGDGVYVVTAGDSLWRIAGRVLEQRMGVDPSNAEIARFWPAIYEANRGTIGENPNLIFPGQRLVIPEG